MKILISLVAIWMFDILCASVSSFSSYTSEARGLKTGMHNLYKDGCKVTSQIFDSLPRSWDI